MKLNITLKKSPIGAIQFQRRTIEALGLRKIGQTVTQPDNPSIRGMIFTVKHMVEVVEVNG